MKGFALDEYGDVILERNDIKLAYDTDLLIQTIRQVLRTNRGEWWMNPKEGVPVRKILKKNPNSAMIRDYVRSAIAQVDSSLQMEKCVLRQEKRTLRISFSLSSKTGTIEAEMEV